MLKKNYLIIDTQKGSPQELCPINNAVFPNILVFRDNWVAVCGDNAIIFDINGKPIPEAMIPLQATSKSAGIVGMVIQNYYLLVIKDSSVSVYNLLDFTKAQEVELEKGLIFRDLAIDSGNVYLAMDVSTGVMKEAISTICYLKETPPGELIKRLLGEGQIDDALKVYLQNHPGANEQQKEGFFCEAAWSLFKNFDFQRAEELFLRVNYDPKEFFAIVPGILEVKDKPFITFNDLFAAKKIPTSKSDYLLPLGIQMILNLAEAKRKKIEESYDIVKEFKKPLSFIYPAQSINESIKTKKYPLDEVIETIDNSYIRICVDFKKIKELQNFLNTTKILKANMKKLLDYLKEKQDKDRSFTAQAALALLACKNGEWEKGLQFWKIAGAQAPKEIRDLACKETVKILMTQIKDKKIIFEFAKMILIINVEDGLKIFTDNETISQYVSDDDILTYLESLETYQAQLKEKFLEYLVAKKDSEERFHTLLGLHYVTKIKETLKKEKNKP